MENSESRNNVKITSKLLISVLTTMCLILVCKVENAASRQTTNPAFTFTLSPNKVWKTFNMTTAMIRVKTSQRKRDAWHNKSTQGPTFMKYKAKIVYLRHKRRIQPARKSNCSGDTSLLDITKGVVLDSQFIVCYKWRLMSKEYICRNKTIYLIKHNLSYDIGKFLVSPSGPSVYVCIPEELSPQLAFFDLVILIDWLISIVGIILAIFTHGLLVQWRKQHRLRPFICHNVCLLILYITMVVGQLTWDNLISQTCITIGGFCILAAFAWLNVISLDTYRRFHPVIMFRSFSLVSPQRKLFFQSLYAWGLPLMCAGIAFAINCTSMPASEAWKGTSPMLANIVQVSFVETIIIILAVANFVFIFMVMKNVYTMRREIRHETDHSDEPCCVYVYMKLMVASGVFWVLETIRWIAIRYTPQSHFWILTDILCGAQGLWLFLIYCCNSAVIKLLKEEMQKIRQ